jgi:predicted ATPase
MIPEMARILIGRGLPMNDKVSELSIVCYVAEYLKHTRRATADLVISDRSVFDLYAYISHSKSDDVRAEYLEMVREQVADEVDRVHAYIYLPIEFELVADQVRPSDAQYREAIDNNVRRLLKEFGANVLEIGGSLAERTEKLKAFLCSNQPDTKA